MKIIGISGSLRKASYNTALLRACKKLAPDGMEIEIVSIDGLPVYNEDLEQDFPSRVRELRDTIVSADGVILAVAEFNRTPSGALKNFLDWSSRPESEPNPWNKKPVAICGVSSGPRGASFAQYDIRRLMGYFNARVLNQPEVYIGPASERFNEALELVDERSRAQISKLLVAFAAAISS